MLQFILLGSGADQRRENRKTKPRRFRFFRLVGCGLQEGLQCDSLHIHWCSLRLELVVRSCAVVILANHRKPMPGMVISLDVEVRRRSWV